MLITRTRIRNAQRPTRNATETLRELKRRVLVLLLPNQRKLFAFHHRATDRDLRNILAARHVVHDVEHDSLEHRPQSARARAFGDGLGRQGAEGILGHVQAHAFHREELGVLLDHRVLRLGQDHHHLVFRQRIERGHDRQASDELRDHPEAQQVLRFDMPHRRFRERFFDFDARTAEAHRPVANALLHDLVQADERPAADEQNLFRVHLDVFLMRMFPPALRRNVARAAFENFQQRLLHALAGNVTGDAHVVGLAADLVDFVDVNDPDLRALHVVVRILQAAAG